MCPVPTVDLHPFNPHNHSQANTANALNLCEKTRGMGTLNNLPKVKESKLEPRHLDLRHHACNQYAPLSHLGAEILETERTRKKKYEFIRSHNRALLFYIN